MPQVPPPESLLSGWGRYPRQACRVFRPDTLHRLQQVIVDGGQPDYIPRGWGRSYGDAALNEHRGVILQTRRDDFLDFDPSQGLLDCEAGVSLRDIVDTCLPHGWFLPVTPGTQFVTLGGAIAADVHGKNSHRDGSFGEHVRSMHVCLANGENVSCDPQTQADLFAATVGGMGLTGVITRARIQLIPITSAFLRVRIERTTCLEQTLERLSATESQYRYSVAWIDALPTGRQRGRGVLMLANCSPHDDLPPRLRDQPRSRPLPPARSIRITAPNRTLNRATAKAFNMLYYASHTTGEKWLALQKFFYPLDGLSDWNRLYGRRGFVQYQALFPHATAADAIRSLLECAAQSRQVVTLAVLKSTRASPTGLLSFLQAGHTIALDLPNTGQPVRRLCQQFDQILLRYGGRLYLAKDALMNAETFAAMYPQRDRFLQVKAQVDPHTRFASSQARRVGLVPRR